MILLEPARNILDELESNIKQIDNPDSMGFHMRNAKCIGSIRDAFDQLELWISYSRQEVFAVNRRGWKK